MTTSTTPPARPISPRRFARLGIVLGLLLATLPCGPPVAAFPEVRAVADVPGLTGEPRFSWPLSPAPTVTRPFRPPPNLYGAGHRGVDLAARPGQDVLAAGAGFVVFAGTLAGRGVVSVEHDGGLRTTYEPVAPAVAAGEQVYQGQAIGTVVAGHPGCPATACLHWGVLRGEEYLDPLRLVRVDTALRLKPWEGMRP